MKRYILTGMPGAGKTSLIRALEMQGHCVVDEAATDIIAYDQSLGISEPWKHKNFLDQITFLQKHRQTQFLSPIQFYDRSPFCTYALAVYLGFSPPAVLTEEIARIQQYGIYEKQVFFIENLGFCTPSEARKISFDEALLFEDIHRNVYKQFGYTCISIPPGSIQKRLDKIIRTVEKLA